MVRRDMKYGDPKPAHISNGTVVRKAVQEGRDIDHGSLPGASLQDSHKFMKNSPRYSVTGSETQA